MRKEAILEAVTRTENRKLLYHFTRAANLPAIACFDALSASSELSPGRPGEPRREPATVRYRGASITINPHLRIADRMIDPSTTQEIFRSLLDRHVFFWPTRRDCRKMLDTYTRREPGEGFAVLAFDARSLLAEHYSQAKLTKYDSGSSPRYPERCSYRKSPAMFLPLPSFGTAKNPLVPATAGEIREVLVERRVSHLSRYLRAIYIGQGHAVPEGWSALAKPLDELAAT